MKQICFWTSETFSRRFVWRLNSHLFSLALCLKSSMAFLKRVTLKSPLSLSSYSKLKTQIILFSSAKKLAKKKKYFQNSSVGRNRSTGEAPFTDSLWGSRHHHLSQSFIRFLPVWVRRPKMTERRDASHRRTAALCNHLRLNQVGILRAHFGTTTSRVIRYSESRTKFSFLTMSARLLVSRLPLVAHRCYNNTNMQTHLARLQHLRVLPLQVLQVSFQVVIGWSSGLQIVVNLGDLLWKTWKSR